MVTTGSLFAAISIPFTLSQWFLLVIFLLFVPLLIWRFMRTLSEWLPVLVCMLSFVGIDGYTKHFAHWELLALLLACIMIVLGLSEHFQFRELVERFQARQRELSIRFPLTSIIVEILAIGYMKDKQAMGCVLLAPVPSSQNWH